MTNEKVEFKSSTELALKLYPLIKDMIDSDPLVRAGVMAEALFLLMLMADGPSTAGRLINSVQVRT